VNAPRYRCTACGNLTRFDVTTARRTRAYHHYTVGGELSVEDEQVLDQVIEAVECRWCGSAGQIETVDDNDTDADSHADTEAAPAGAEGP